MSRFETFLKKPGLLPRQLLKEAVKEGYISSSKPLSEHSFQPATLELRLGDIAYRLRAAFSPHPQRSIQASIEALAEHVIRLDPADGAVLENNHFYLLPLAEALELPPTLRGKASPKSSIGRLDVFVRLLAEGTNRFDDVPRGYRGNLYVLVAPRSFAVVVRPGTSVAQLRLLTTTPGAIVRDSDLVELWTQHALLYTPKRSADPRPIGYEKAHLEEGLFLTADFRRPPRAALAYASRRAGAVIDVDKLQQYKVEKYWEGVLPEDEPNVLRLSPDSFYLVQCQELLSIPPSLAAEMLPYDAQLGELRTHYAGFFDPGFGYDPAGVLLGSSVVLEVRSQEAFIVPHGHMLCRLLFFRMIEDPDLVYGDPVLQSSYQRQKSPFSKHFILTDTGEQVNHGRLVQGELEFE